ncbi:MAG: TIGR00296 family protein [Fervidicoccaceae archaeon]
MVERPLDPEELTLEEGAYLVKVARQVVERFFLGERPKLERGPEKLRRPGAAFVTIEKLSKRGKELRGCVGFVEPARPLEDAVTEAALAAAFEDPRFPPLKFSELPLSVFEVTVLSRLSILPGEPEERPKKVEVGRMGLVVKHGIFSGLLLPQVPVEHGWDAETFLSYTCLKAGMRADCWKRREVEVYYFTGRIFAEKEPGGDVEERILRTTSE